MSAPAAARAQLTGRVVRPGDDDYPAVSAGWNLRVVHHPAVVVLARETQDVVNALAWARQNDVAVRVRSGGHCLEGWSSVDDGIVIDLRGLKSATIDATSRTATVGAGLTQLEAVTVLGEAGFAAPTGTEGSVGLAGATLGGGFGLLTRSLGMACDNLLAAEVVLAAGADGAEVVTVDAEHHPDLLWALRGAGNGQLGVVTSLTYALHPLARTSYVTATWPGLDDLPAVFDAWQRSAPTADERLTSQLEIHRDAVTVIAVLAEGPEAEALELLAPILSVGSPEVVATDGPWAHTYAGFQVPLEDEPASWKFTSQFVVEPFSAEAVAVVRSFMERAPAPGCNYFANAFGGAVARSEPAGGAAFAHRGALFYAEPGAGWGERGGLPAAEDPLTAECEAWVAEFTAALQPHGHGAYVNVPNAGASDWETAYWGPNVARLRTVKATYDPDGVFTFEQSIAPPR